MIFSDIGIPNAWYCHYGIISMKYSIILPLSHYITIIPYPMPFPVSRHLPLRSCVDSGRTSPPWPRPPPPSPPRPSDAASIARRRTSTWRAWRGRRRGWRLPWGDGALLWVKMVDENDENRWKWWKMNEHGGWKWWKWMKMVEKMVGKTPLSAWIVWVEVDLMLIWRGRYETYHWFKWI